MHSGVDRPKMSKNAHETSFPPKAPPSSSDGFASHSCTATVCSGSAPTLARYRPSAEKARSSTDALCAPRMDATRWPSDSRHTWIAGDAPTCPVATYRLEGCMTRHVTSSSWALKKFCLRVAVFIAQPTPAAW